VELRFGTLGQPFAGTGDRALLNTSPRTSARFEGLGSLAKDSVGNFWVADPLNRRIRAVDESFDSVFAVGTGAAPTTGGDGGPISDAAFPNSMTAVARNAAGDLFVAEYLSHKVRVLHANGTVGTFAGNGAAGSSGDSGPAVQAELQNPSGLAVDADGNVYIA